MQKSPLHVVLSQDQRLPRAIQLSPQRNFKYKSPKEPEHFKPEEIAAWQNLCQTSQSSSQTQSSASSSSPVNESGGESPSTSLSSLVSDEVQFPRMAISIRLEENLDTSDLSVDLLAQWLQMMPILAKNVRVEAGFASFSTLLIMSMPVAQWCYIDSHPAITTMGIIKSANLIREAIP